MSSADELSLCAQRSSRALDDCLGPCEPDGAAIDGALKSAMDEALAAIDLDVDSTKGTRDYVRWLKQRRRALEKGRLKWGDWTKLGSSLPKKKSVDHVTAVVAAGRVKIGQSIQ